MLYVYDPTEGYYRERGEPFVRDLVANNLNRYWSTRNENEAVRGVRSRKYEFQSDFNGGKWEFNVADGVLDVRDRTLDDHDSDKLFRGKSPAAYDPDAAVDAGKLREGLPGVLNRALDGLDRLLEQGGFTGDRRPHETQDTWESWGSSIAKFKSAVIEKDPGRKESKSETYNACLRFCRDRASPPWAVSRNSPVTVRSKAIARRLTGNDRGYSTGLRSSGTGSPATRVRTVTMPTQIRPAWATTNAAPLLSTGNNFRFRHIRHIFAYIVIHVCECGCAYARYAYSTSKCV